MKRKAFLILLCLTIVGATVGCGFKATALATSSSSSTSSTTETETVSVDSEYSELTIKTDWDEMASVTISGSDITIDGNGCTDESGILYITEGGAYTITGSSDSCMIVINTDENVKLILNGVDLTSTSGPVIYGAQVKNLYIELADGTANTLTDSEDYTTDSSTGEEIGKGVISCEDDIIILGEGTLNITGNHKHGIVSDDKLYIESGTINITTNGSDGLHANDLICIDGGVINIEAASDMMESEDTLIINGGTITGSSEDEGIESKNSIYINGGTIDITTVDDGLNATNYIEINDGEINIVSTNGDAADCNGGYDGCITINGGTLDLTGAGVPEGALDADEASIIINGGTVTAEGGTNSNVIENGGEVTITGETNAGMGGGPGGPGGQGGQGGQGGPGGGRGQGNPNDSQQQNTEPLEKN